MLLNIILLSTTLNFFFFFTFKEFISTLDHQSHSKCLIITKIWFPLSFMLMTLIWRMKCYIFVYFLYLSFYADFGPLNLAMVYRYCCKLNKKLKVSIEVMLLKGLNWEICPLGLLCTHHVVRWSWTLEIYVS